MLRLLKSLNLATKKKSIKVLLLPASSPLASGKGLATLDYRSKKQEKYFEAANIHHPTLSARAKEA